MNQGLTINTGKTEGMVFSKRANNIISTGLNFGNNLVNFIFDCKFLGVNIDRNLTFGSHIDQVCAKISKNCGILYKIRNELPLQARVDFYYAFIYPYLTYNVVVWGVRTKPNLCHL